MTDDYYARILAGEILSIDERCVLVLGWGLADRLLVVGSWAAGTARPDSDLDLRFVLTLRADLRSATKIMLEYQGWNFDFSLNWRGRFYANDHAEERWRRCRRPRGPVVPFLELAARRGVAAGGDE